MPLEHSVYFQMKEAESGRPVGRASTMAQSIGTTFVPLPLIYCVNPDERGKVARHHRPARFCGCGVWVEALRPAHHRPPGSLAGDEDGRRPKPTAIDRPAAFPSIRHQTDDRCEFETPHS